MHAEAAQLDALVAEILQAVCSTTWKSFVGTSWLKM
jgi:hypothetical protein